MIVNNVISKSTREFTEVGVSIQFSGESGNIPVLIIIDEKFNSEFEINGLLELYLILNEIIIWWTRTIII